jgi:hypothetical protein
VLNTRRRSLIDQSDSDGSLQRVKRGPDMVNGANSLKNGCAHPGVAEIADKHLVYAPRTYCGSRFLRMNQCTDWLATP